MRKKYNTKLFSSGAEFLVLAKLLLARIETYLAYENQEGYDLISINAKKNLSAKIQVKSKNFKGDSSFYLNKDDKTKSSFYRALGLESFLQGSIKQEANELAIQGLEGDGYRIERNNAGGFLSASRDRKGFGEFFGFSE